MSDIEKAVTALKSGELIVLPTETVYGLFADATNQAAVEKLYAVKGRPTEKALNLNIADPVLIHTYARDFPDFLDKLVEKFLPGPLTIILKASDQVPEWVHVGKDTIGFRMPRISETQEIIQQVGVLVGPSANLTGDPSPVYFKDLQPEILREAVVALQDDSIQGLDTTILDLSTYPQTGAKILRQGAVTKAALQEVVPDLKFI
ncbi:MAG: threonylcarbamoyl-AMP synthase [Streptococcaceae bacterium]|jgi:L-threonylcarbamoyladenylate synthase|nr:threonylcarbamoyl-AMP synthase [Streptococcaceae bacterium]